MQAANPADDRPATSVLQVGTLPVQAISAPASTRAPYIPTFTDTPTLFPIPLGKDFRTQVRMIEEKWRRQFPLVQYRPIRIATTERSTTLDAPVGEAGTTRWDPVFGESVDPAMTVLTQPHLSADYNAFDNEIFGDAVPINLRINIDVSDEDLKRWGFEKKADAIVAVPASLLDTASLTVQAGDRFTFAAQEYVVKGIGFDGQWKNTDVWLYIMLNCTTRRIGS